MHLKIQNREEILHNIARIRAAGKTIVFTNGCFDVLHAGHVRYLAAAKALGDCLIVGLNSDASVRVLKGPERPVNHEEDRAEVLAALAAVDYIVIFSEITAEALVSEMKPDIYTKGGDYNTKDLPEGRIVESYGGRTVLLPEVPGRSSTNIIKRLRDDKHTNKK